MITDAERANMASAITTGLVRKGPKDAVIREVKEGDLDRAFADEGGSIPPGETRAVSRSSGGRGSLAGIRVGAKEAGGGTDARAIEIKFQRREAARQKAANSGGPTIQPKAPTRALEAPVSTQKPDLEPWEQSEATEDFTMTNGGDPAPYIRKTEQGDLLDRGYRNALKALAFLPDGAELYLGGPGHELLIGIGYLIGKGGAAYRGDGHFKITEAGRAAAKDLGL